MYFNSWVFAAFAVVVTALFALAPQRWRAYVLILAGLAFYAESGPANVLLVVAAALGTYGVARVLAGSGARERRVALAFAAIAALVVLLAYFKYAHWLSDAFAGALPGRFPVFGPLVAPLAISFFTFEFIHFLAEVHAGRIKEFTLKQFLVFALFFPTMIAGPIKRYGTFVPQVDGLRPARGAELHAALYRILLGLFKKVAIADPVSLFAQPIFHPDPSYTAATYLVALVAGSVKVYYDLGGYSDMAIGFGALFGVRVPENFARPYRATNLVAFWSRWHMSLTSWVRDYVYVPMAKRLREPRSGRSAIRPSVIVSMFAVMVIVGVWHGAGWQFVAWGVWNGACVAVYHLWRGGVVRRVAWLRAPSPALTALSTGLTYASFTFGLGWIAAPSLADALTIYRTFL
ncbi:MAG TPA: MBOAT family O-acyltransferase [Candidatus Baltobacteraceae bacterium]|nr:MBOAT family O-acyltransferase [Candidatus Baltobacteraceae bacterium]